MFSGKEWKKVDIVGKLWVLNSSIETMMQSDGLYKFILLKSS